jgi:hypothetical protein
MDRERKMNSASTIAVTIILVIYLTTSSSGLFQFASAFVQITSPPKNEVVTAGSPLEVLGTSDDNTQFNCNIQIIVNNNRPYQNATPVAGPGDYSKWSFTITPQYAEIEPGINKITSKAICDARYEPFLVQDNITRQFVKFYSINVTGTPSSLGNFVPSPEAPSASPDEQSSGDGDLGGNGDLEGDEGNAGPGDTEESSPDDELFE